MTAFTNTYLKNMDIKFCKNDMSLPAVVIKGLAEHTKVHFGHPFVHVRLDIEAEVKDG
jgi:ferredoxin-thioredoxin reductase catalytic subunit